MIHDEARQVVALGVDRPPEVAGLLQAQGAPAQAERRGEQLAQRLTRPIPVAALAPGEDPDADVAGRIEEAVPNESVGGVAHLDEGPGLHRVGGLDLAPVDPGASGQAVGEEVHEGVRHGRRVARARLHGPPRRRILWRCCSSRRSRWLAPPCTP